MVIHIGTARCKKSKNERLVMKSFLNCVEKLPGGFEEGKVTDQWKLWWKTGARYVMSAFAELHGTSKTNRSPALWIRRTLTGNEGWIKIFEYPDHSFTKKNFLRVILSKWKSYHRRLISGSLQAITTLALQLYIFSGARIGAFIPAHEDRDIRGLRYKMRISWRWSCAMLLNSWLRT